MITQVCNILITFNWGDSQCMYPKDQYAWILSDDSNAYGWTGYWNKGSSYLIIKVWTYY